MTILVEVIRSLLWDLRGCFKQEIFEMKGKLTSEGKILSFSSRLIERNKPQRTIYKGPHGILTVIDDFTRSFL